MGCLHRGNHAELREAKDVFVAQNLSVLNTVAQTPCSGLFDELLVAIEHQFVRGVANGVGVHLETRIHRRTHQVLHALLT